MKTLKTSLLIAVVVFVVINQIQLGQAAMMMGEKEMFTAMMETMTGKNENENSTSSKIAGNTSLQDVDVSQIKSTAQGIAAVFPISQIKTQDDAIAMLLPTGVPEYGEAMGVTFDDPEGSLATLSKAQTTLLAGLTPELKARFINLASMPVGISCEYCCGLQAVGIRNDGTSSCGCQHNPALLSVTMWLMQNTDYTDIEVLREVYQWKTLFFPKNMVELGVQIAGGDESVLKNLPGMVGGC
ncbi:hypothetical protein KKB10_00995 [Patescibacteria group bacterium]|nr:hypothetical protein [Patescibacteria group bacterium]MBU1075625.1 hypothetical protein [Patescibacteria group bacterium]MBU1952225.1 hypothetical protein [Patescibacteria group bacterium]